MKRQGLAKRPGSVNRQDLIKRRAVAVVALCALVGAGCGARLSKMQLAALGDSGNNGAGALAPGSGGGTASAGGVSGSVAGNNGTAGSGATGSAAGLSGSAGGSSSGGATAAGSGSGGASGATAGGGGSVAGSGSASPGAGGATSGRSATPSGSAGGSTKTGGGTNVAIAVPPTGKTCAPGAASKDPGVTASTITIGNVSTVSGGPVPGLFAGAREGTEAAVNYINANGGVCGRKLVLKAEDDNFDTATNQSDTQSLESQVLAFAGSFSLQEQGMATALAGTDIPDVGVALTQQRFDMANNFDPTAAPPTTGYLQGPYKYFATKLGPSVIEHMAIFIEDNGVAENAGLAEEKSLESLGYKFPYSELNISPTQSDFSAEINAMKSDGIKGIIFQATAQIIGEMASQMYSAGFTVPFANWSPTAYDPGFLQAAGPGANGAILTTDFAMYLGQDNTPAVQALDEYYKATNNAAPDLFGFYGWLSVLLLVQGINAGGAPTRAATMAGLKTITNFSAGGLVAPDNPAGKQPPTCWIAIDVKGNQFVRDPASPSGYVCNPGGYG